MRYMTPACLAILAFASTPCLSSAQASRPDLRDHEVRVFKEGLVYEGTVIETAPGHLRLAQAGREPMAILWSDVEELHVATKTRRWKEGGLIGAAGGGLLIGLVAEELESCFLRTTCDDQFHTETFLQGLAIGALGGGVAGVIVGSLVKQTHWTPIMSPSNASVPGQWTFGVELRLPNLQ